MVHTLKPHIFSEGFYRAQKIPYILYINRYRGKCVYIYCLWMLPKSKFQQFPGVSRELHEIGIRIGQGADRGRTGKQIGHSSRTIVLKTSRLERIHRDIHPYTLLRTVEVSYHQQYLILEFTQKGILSIAIKTGIVRIGIHQIIELSLGDHLF